jgi:hypothetical protein
MLYLKSIDWKCQSRLPNSFIAMSRMQCDQTIGHNILTTLTYTFKGDIILIVVSVTQYKEKWSGARKNGMG